MRKQHTVRDGIIYKRIEIEVKGVVVGIIITLFGFKFSKGDV